jgi:hypothetical protein
VARAVEEEGRERLRLDELVQGTPSTTSWREEAEAQGRARRLWQQWVGREGGGPGGERKANRDDTCLNCHCTGHWAKDYPQHRRERGGASHLTEADDDEATMFLAHGFLELEEHVLCSKADADLDLIEPRVWVFLNTSSGEDKLDGWYLDSGTTHHMTSCHELFSDLDTIVRGSMRFSNASKVEIQGVGSIVFQAKNGEHRVLHGVYFISTLRNSIMNLGSSMKAGSRWRLTKACFASRIVADVFSSR